MSIENLGAVSIALYGPKNDKGEYRKKEDILHAIANGNGEIFADFERHATIKSVNTIIESYDKEHNAKELQGLKMSDNLKVLADVVEPAKKLVQEIDRIYKDKNFINQLDIDHQTYIERYEQLTKEEQTCVQGLTELFKGDNADLLQSYQTAAKEKLIEAIQNELPMPPSTDMTEPLAKKQDNVKINGDENVATAADGKSVREIFLELLEKHNKKTGQEEKSEMRNNADGSKDYIYRPKGMHDPYSINFKGNSANFDPADIDKCKLFIDALKQAGHETVKIDANNEKTQKKLIAYAESLGLKIQGADAAPSVTMKNPS